MEQMIEKVLDTNLTEEQKRYQEIIDKDNLKIRALDKEEDLLFIKEWWKKWPEWEAPADTFLPSTGVVVEAENKPVAACFVYLTNAKVGLIEWVVSDPDYRESNRKTIIELLIISAEEMLRVLDYDFAFSVCRSQHLIKTHEKLDWSVDKKPSHELVKIINK